MVRHGQCWFWIHKDYLEHSWVNDWWNMTQTSMLRMDNQEDLTITSPNRDRIQKILGNTVHDRAFFFYEDVGKPTGDFAASLSDFCSKINTVNPKSLAFHLKRGDFENWVQEVIGDNELSQRIRKLKTYKITWKNDTTLRKRLHTVIKDRISELQDLWQSALKSRQV